MSQQWCLQRSARGYALANAHWNIYLGINDDGRGNKLDPVCEHNASIWSIEHQHDDKYNISLLGTQMYLTLPEGYNDPGASIMLTERRTERQLWRFERISDDSRGVHQPRNSMPFYAQPLSAPNSSGSSTIVSGDPNSPYVDDAHFHTDMLFSLQRVPFTRMQRAVVLEWARKMGTPNVPTLESLDECERRISGRAIPDSENNLKRE